MAAQMPFISRLLLVHKALLTSAMYQTALSHQYQSSIMISFPPFGICREKHVLGYTTDTAVSCTHLKVHNNNYEKKIMFSNL